MSYLHHHDLPLTIIDRVERSEGLLPEAVLLVAGELLTAVRPRLRGQASESGDNRRRCARGRPSSSFAADGLMKRL